MTEGVSTHPLLIVGTGNPHKVEEIATMLSDVAVEVRGSDVLPEVPDVDETGATFEANAALKAIAFAKAAAVLRHSSGGRRIWVLSDDSGLCVDALDGRPGVHSARYAASNSNTNADSAANNRKLVAELSNVADDLRSAHFVCVAALATVPRTTVQDSTETRPKVLFTVRGECHGVIAREERGTGGFGYDPLFVVPALGLTFAELPPQEKNRMSHRARALLALREKLKDLVDSTVSSRRPPSS